MLVAFSGGNSNFLGCVRHKTTSKKKKFTYNEYFFDRFRKFEISQSTRRSHSGVIDNKLLPVYFLKSGGFMNLITVESGRPV